MNLSRIFIFTFFQLLFVVPLAAQSGDPEQAPDQKPATLNVFVDCRSCDMTYIRQEVDYVNHVRDQQMAQVHVFVTQVRTGSGSRTFNLEFLGREQFDGIVQKLDYIADPTLTPDEVRRGFTKKLELGLVTFLAHTEMADAIDVNVQDSGREKVVEALEHDPWNNWIFNIDGGGFFNKESQRSTLSLRASISADRVTEMWRIRSGARYNLNNRRFLNSDEETIVSIVESSSVFASVVRSLGNHWSTGLFSGYSSSTFSNIDLSLSLMPAIEYSLFPYSEVAKREVTVAYRVGPIYREYGTETIYDKLSESLWRQSVLVRVRFNQPWGTVYAALEGFNFFHDFSKNRMEFDSRVSLRVYKGLAVNLSSSIEFIRDQLALPKGEASLEDLLLQQRQLATDYEAFVSVGLSYTFGSMYNNIVNTRL